MDSKDWYLLQILHEEKNITRAAERMFISQPALTYRIRQLEEEFGVTILFRNKRGISFTPEGEYILDYARQMLLQLQKAKEHLAQLSHEVTGQLRLGVASNFAYYRLPRILRHFHEIYPKVQVNLYTGLSADMFHLLNNEQIHIAIIRSEYYWTEEKHLVDEEAMCIISSSEFAFAQIPQLPKINYKTDPKLKILLNSWWQEHFDTPPLVTMEVDNVEIAKEMVLNGLGYAIIPETCLKDSDQLHKSTLRWKTGQPVERKTWMMYANATTKLRPVQAFIEFVKEHVSPDQ